MKLNPYLNFMGQTEEAFEFYKSVFGGEYERGGIQRFKDVPDLPNKDQMSEEDLQKVMHVSLPVGENTLMGTDAMPSMGQTLTMGDNVSLSLHPESKEEGERLLNALADGGTVTLPYQEMFWGAYFGMVRDKFGVNWMVNVDKQ